MKNKNSSILPGPFSNLRDINFGMVLLAIYFLLDFGSFQGVFEILGTLRIPYIVALLSVAYALYLVITKRVKLNELTTISFIVLCFFIIIYSQIKTIEEHSRSAYLTLFLQYLANYLIMVACVKKPSQFILLIDIWLLGILHSSYHAIYQGGKLWDSIWLKDENHISLICAYALPFAFFLFMNYQSKLKKLFYTLCMAAYVTSVVVSASRGGFVAMVSVAFLCWLAIKAKFRSLLIIAIATIAIFTFAPSKFFQEVKTLEQGTEEGTADQRIYLWGIALKMFYDNPILGVGPSNYRSFVLNYDVEDRFYDYYTKGIGRVAHSTPVQWLAETGIIGIIILLTLQIALYRNWKIIHSYKNKNLSHPLIKDHNLFIFKTITDACAIAQAGFWTAALFLSLIPYPFYWCLIPFSETWKNLSVNYIKVKKEELHP